MSFDVYRYRRALKGSGDRTQLKVIERVYATALVAADATAVSHFEDPRRLRITGVEAEIAVELLSKDSRYVARLPTEELGALGERTNGASVFQFRLEVLDERDTPVGTFRVTFAVGEAQC